MKSCLNLNLFSNMFHKNSLKSMNNVLNKLVLSYIRVIVITSANEYRNVFSWLN